MNKTIAITLSLMLVAGSGLRAVDAETFTGTATVVVPTKVTLQATWTGGTIKAGVRGAQTAGKLTINVGSGTGLMLGCVEPADAMLDERYAVSLESDKSRLYVYAGGQGWINANINGVDKTCGEVIPGLSSEVIFTTNAHAAPEAGEYKGTVVVSVYAV